MADSEKKKKVSIIVPIYKVEKYLNECIDSILNQTLREIEVILVDDGSKDRCSEIVDEYISLDSRVIGIHRANGGLSAARNTGLEHATAPYVMFCDSDDYYSPQMCEVMYKAIEASSADIAVCGTNIIYEADEGMREIDDRYYSIKFNGLKSWNELYASACDVSAWNKIHRRSVIEKYQLRFPEGLKYEDFYFFHAYMLYCNKIYFIKEKLHNYRRREGSIMNQTFNSTSTSSIDHLRVAILLWELYKKEGKLEQNRWLINDLFFEGFWFALNLSGNSKDADNVLKLASEFARKELVVDPEFKQYRRLEILCLKSGKNPRIESPLITTKLPNWRESLELIIKEGTIPYFFHGLIVGKDKITGDSYDYTFRRSILGIRVSKKKVNLVSRLPKLRCMHRGDSRLLRELNNLGPFTYIPNPGNMGDMLIAGATLGFFEKERLPYTLYKDASDKNTVVYGGGGIWINEYKEHWIQFLPLFKQAKRVVILPSSFNNCAEFLEILDERFVVFCREKQSYNYLTSAKTKAKVILDHDMALRMNLDCYTQELLLSFYDEKYQNANLSHLVWNFPPIEEQGRFFREDCESNEDDTTRSNDIDLSTFVYGDENSSREEILFAALLLLSLVDQVKEVVTDRLHVGIAGILLRKKVVMGDNSYGKNAAVYEHSLKHQSGLQFLSTGVSQYPRVEPQPLKRAYRIQSVLLTA